MPLHPPSLALGTLSSLLTADQPRRRRPQQPSSDPAAPFFFPIARPKAAASRNTLYHCRRLQPSIACSPSTIVASSSAASLPFPAVVATRCCPPLLPPCCCRQPQYPHLPCRNSCPKRRHARSVLPSVVAILPQPCTATVTALVAATQPLPPLLYSSRSQPLPSPYLPSSSPR
ncbi:hypothetical protein GW17_00002218 [Ensete ventricosum]|nr:hypothetical protein GW17_00002218 [Ensete ventricosum]